MKYFSLNIFLGLLFGFNNFIFSQNYFPSTISGLSLWVAADSVSKDNNNKISILYDMSGNHNDVIQNNPSFQPFFIDTSAFIQPIARFNGISDFMSFNEITDIRTCFFVLKHATGSSTNYPVILGHSSAYNFEGNKGTLLFESTYASPFLISGQGFVNGISTPPSSMIKPKLYSIISLITTGNVKAENVSSFRVGLEYWAGDYAEIILYNQPLTSEERQQVEQYLRDKYAPPVDLGPDINITYGLCDTTIHAGKRYTNYVWNTGDTSESIKVNHSGLYSVSVTDIFGFTSTDTIWISFPNTNLNITDTTICLGNKILVNSVISSQPGYTFLWSDLSTETDLYVSSPQKISVTITDSKGCSKISDTINVKVDSLKDRIYLGKDKNLCAGNSISLAYYPENPTNLTFLWSDHSGDSLLPVFKTGDYSITVTNKRSCSGSDTIHVTITGTAPFADFTINPACLGDSTLIINHSTIEFDSLFWNFGDGTFSEIFNPSHVFKLPGNYMVKLVIYYQGCFNSVSKATVIKLKPSADFSFSQSCKSFPVDFINLSSTQGSGKISNYLWNFDGLQKSSVENTSFVFTNSGNHSVTLSITSTNGCSDSVTKIINTVITTAIPAISLNQPLNNSTISTNSINFSWFSSNSIKNILELSFDSLFSTIYFTTTTTLNNVLLTINLSNFQSVFWRVRTFNYCYEEKVSQTFKFTYFKPSLVSGLSLWVASDSVSKDNNNKISILYDMSSNHNDVIQNNPSFQPIFIDTSAFIQPIARFNGISDFMSFNEITDIRTCFFVLKHATGSSTNYPVILGHSSAYNFEGNKGTLLFESTYASPFLISGEGFVNGISTPPSSMIKPKLYSIISLITTGNVKAENVSSFRVGLEYWAGDYAEIILYNKPLTTIERQNVELYLRNKYTPPVNIGPDIHVAYGFCDTSIHAGKRFTKFLWSTGDTTESIKTNHSGKYSVTVTDIFGFTSSDEINITFPEIKSKDTLICMNSKAILNPGLGENYLYQWFDSKNNQLSNDSIFSTDIEDTYRLIIKDSNNCSVTKAIHVVVDSFEVKTSFGADNMAFCEGSQLKLYVGADLVKSYHWSNNSTDAEITIINPGQYTVTSLDQYGCKSIDSIKINIKGKKPSPHFSTKLTCYGDSTEFIDSSSGLSSKIIERKWNFENDQLKIITDSLKRNISHYFTQPGFHPVKLTVTNVNGCMDSIQKNIFITSLPQVYFIPTNGCTGTPVQFTDKSKDTLGDIVQRIWYFGKKPDGVSDSTLIPNPIHTFDTAGVHEVKLKIKSSTGCVNELIRNVQINLSPTIDFTFTNTCLGQQTFFSDISITDVYNQIMEWNWTYNNIIFSKVKNPYLKFEETGKHDVTMKVKALNGCINSIQKSVMVHSNPVAAFNAQTVCVTQPVEFSDNSIVDNDTIVQWKWMVSQIEKHNTKNPVFIFKDTGIYHISLQVLSSNDCLDSIGKNIHINIKPTAAFSYSPEFGSPPLEVNFTNHSLNADTWEWRTDNEKFSISKNPIHVFTENKKYDVSLIAKNSVGCSDTIIYPIFMKSVLADIVVKNAVIKKVNTTWKISITLVNQGSTQIKTLDLIVSVNGGFTFHEMWDGILEPGKSENYDFNAMIDVASQNTGYICVSAVIPGYQPDADPDNNLECIALVNSFYVFNPFPNPANDNIIFSYILPYEDVVEIILYNSIGEKINVFEGKGVKGYNSQTIGISNFSPGPYFIRIQFNDENDVKKFIKQ